jgi:hypothetical protein
MNSKLGCFLTAATVLLPGKVVQVKMLKLSIKLSKNYIR